MADTVNNKQSVLTEDMIDAAMSQSLKDKSQDLIVTQKDKLGDHNYCEEAYSSESDYQVESVDGFSSDSSQDSLEDDRNISTKTSKTNGERNKDSSENDDEDEESVKIVNIKPSVIVGNSSLKNKEPLNSQLGTRKGLIIKPLTNLLKADFVQEWNNDQTNLKVFKCVNGKLQVIPNMAMPVVEKQNNTVHSTSGSNKKSSSALQTLLGHGLKNKIKVISKEPLNDNTPSDSNNGSSSGKTFSSTGEIKNNKILRTYKNNSNTSNLTKVKISEIGDGRSEKTPTNSLLKNNSKLINSMEPKDGIEKRQVLNDVSSKLPSENKSPANNANDSLHSSEVHDITLEDDTSDESDDEVTIESGESLPSLPIIKKLNTLSKSANSSEKNKKYIYKRKIVPKINFRYHTKDNLIISERLPSTTTTVISLNNKTPIKNNVIKFKPGSSTNNASKSVLLPSYKKSEKIVASQQLIKVSPAVKNATAPKYVRNVINSIITPTTTVTVAKTLPSTVVLSTIAIKNKSIMTTSTAASSSSKVSASKSSNWEKVDRFSMTNEQYNNDIAQNVLISQLTVGELQSYIPKGTNEVYPCLECGDRFALEASLREHKLRKSVLISYWCRTCSCCLNLYNRCMFLSHIRSHNQIFKNLDMSSLSLEPIPKHLLLSSAFELNSSSSNVSSNSCIINAPTSESSRAGIPSSDSSAPAVVSTNATDTQQQPSRDVVSDHTNIENLTNANTTIMQSNNSNEVLQATVSVLVQPEQDIIGDSTEKTSDSLSDSNNDEVIVINEDDVSDNSCTEKPRDSSPLQEDMEITVATPTAGRLAEQQYKILSLNNEYIDTESRTIKQVKGRRKCPECGIGIAPKGSLRKHLQNYNKPLSDHLKCDICHLILPSPCSLRMHLRIHMRKKPFRCPECAIEFTIYDRFIMHLKYTCCHMTKVVRYICSVCKSMVSTVKHLEEHLLTRHVRSIFKCGGCPVAFINMKSAEKHKEKEHPGRIVPTQSYQQCKLCPEKLIPKKKFLVHMRSHLLDDKVRIYAFQCPKCRYTFFHRTELVYHRMKCDSMETAFKSALKEDRNMDSADYVTDSVMNDDEVEFVIPSKKRKMSHEYEVEVIQEEEKDPLSLEGFHLEEPLQEPVEETCVVCKTEKVLILPGKDQSSQSLCCKKCVKPCGVPEKSNSQKGKLMAAKMKGYKCKICNSKNSMDLKSIFLHFKNFHKEYEGQSINEWLIIENNPVNIKKSNTVTTAETIKEKYKKKRTSSVLGGSSNQVVKVKEEPDVDGSDKKECISPDKKKQKKYSKPKGITEGKQFESGKILTQETNNTEFSCCECEFVGTSKDEFRNHVVSHRLDPNALQCLECGECFVVLPSLEKHLIMNHRITDVNKYISDNKQCMPLSYFEEESVNGLANDDSLLSKTCKVCYEVFESKPALDKHFRSHGMAFLFKKQQQ